MPLQLFQAIERRPTTILEMSAAVISRTSVSVLGRYDSLRFQPCFQQYELFSPSGGGDA